MLRRDSRLMRDIKRVAGLYGIDPIHMIGAIVGGWLGAMAGIGGPVGSFSLGGLVTAVIGALVILAVFRAVSK